MSTPASAVDRLFAALTSADELEPAKLPRWRETFRDEVRAASEAGSFGLAIPALIDPTIVPSAGEIASILARANVVSVMSDVYRPVVSAGASWAFSSEASTYADDTPTFVQPSVTINTAKAFVPTSLELDQDYPAWQEEITQVLQRGYVDLLWVKTAVRSGSGEPFGLFTRMASTTTSPSHVAVTTAGHIGAVDVRAAFAALPERFGATSTWVMHQDVLPQIRNIAGAASQVDLVTDRQGVALMGRPVVTSSYCPDFTGTSASESFLTIGDLSGYTVAQRLGVTVEFVPQMRDSATGRPLGQRGYMAYARVGADVTVPNSQVLLANS